MPAFNAKSLKKLSTCDPRLQDLFNEVVKNYDCTILEGHRGQVEQDAAFAAGNSQKKWPDGNHNKLPSMAVDAAPYPVEFPLDTDTRGIKIKKLMQFSRFAGYVLRIAETMGLKLRWGGDWDMDLDLKDNSFDDLVHFEITK